VLAWANRGPESPFASARAPLRHPGHLSVVGGRPSAAWEDVEGSALAIRGVGTGDRYGPSRAGGVGAWLQPARDPSRSATEVAQLAPGLQDRPRRQGPAAIDRLLAPQQGAEVEVLMEDRVGPGLEGQLTVRSVDELTGV
jgi:hypothetical protein